MDGSLPAAFWAVSMLFVLTPGVDWAYAMSSGLRRGGLVPAVSGMLVGHFTATCIVAAGVAALITASEFVMVALTVLGALYLIWLGISSVRHPAVPSVEADSITVRGTRSFFAKGLGISLLNPKVFLLFLALLPQFASKTALWPEGAQVLVLGAIHVANCALVYFAVGAGAGRVLRDRPQAAVIVGMLSGVVMIVLGLGLIVEKIISLA